MMLNTTGTKNKVDTVAKISPPITARPKGAFCSPPSPSPRDMGNMPITMASAVMSTGRSLTNPASSAAWVASPNSVSFSRAKLTTSTLLAVATPMHMMAPVERRHGQRGMRREQHPDDAGERRRKGRDDDEGITPGLEIDDDEEVDQHDGADQSEQQTLVGALHGLGLTYHRDDRPLGLVLIRAAHDAADVGGHRAQIASLHRREYFHHG